ILLLFPHVYSTLTSPVDEIW
ncbi:putative membrane protein, partial [Chlamydia psittaci 03DC29]